MLKSRSIFEQSIPCQRDFLKPENLTVRHSLNNWHYTKSRNAIYCVPTMYESLTLFFLTLAFLHNSGTQYIAFLLNPIPYPLVFLRSRFHSHSPHGTGSCPCPPPGRHLEILLIVSHPPLNKPYFLNASIPYWLHVGVNRQDAGNKGDKNHW